MDARAALGAISRTPGAGRRARARVGPPSRGAEEGPRSYCPRRRARLMDASKLGRRDFHRLSLAALGGALAGATLGSCKSKEKDAMAEVKSGAHPLLSEPHVCRGLNTCEGKGAGGGNQCAGTGKCATAKSHSCHGMNDCKGQGG